MLQGRCTVKVVGLVNFLSVFPVMSPDTYGRKQFTT